MVRLRGRAGNRYAVYVAGAEPRQRQRVDNGHHHAAALRSVRRGGEVRYNGGHVQVEEPAVVARGSCHRGCGDACGMRNILGFLTYLLAAVIFGGGMALVLLAVHEDNDRCHYYNGSWNKGDLLSGVIAITVGMALRYLLCANSGIRSVIEIIA